MSGNSKRKHAARLLAWLLSILMVVSAIGLTLVYMFNSSCSTTDNSQEAVAVAVAAEYPTV